MTEELVLYWILFISFFMGVGELVLVLVLDSKWWKYWYWYWSEKSGIAHLCYSQWISDLYTMGISKQVSVKSGKSGFPVFSGSGNSPYIFRIYFLIFPIHFSSSFLLLGISSNSKHQIKSLITYYVGKL